MKTTVLTVNTLFRRSGFTSAEWKALVDQLHDDDQVVAWTGNVGWRGTYRLRADWDDPRVWDEFAVTHMASWNTGLSWVGARAVVDKAGDVWVRVEADVFTHSGSRHPAEWIEQSFGPCRVLLDADGRVPVDTVMHVNHVTRRQLVHRVATTSRSGGSAVGIVLDTLSGL